MAESELVREPDFWATDHGSVVMVAPLSAGCKEWVEQNVATQAWQWAGPFFACEPRMAGEVIRGMQNDGFVGTVR
jgi:hypothetical protein